MTVDTLRQRHPRIRYQLAEYTILESSVECRWQYLLEPNLAFQTKTVIRNLPRDFDSQIDHDVLQNFISQLGLIELFSYWKLACPPEIVIEVDGFSSAQLPFWKQLLPKGLSEFLFIHKIDGWQKDFVKWTLIKETTLPVDSQKHGEPPLLGIGGGKDSVVAAETLLQANLPFEPFAINESVNMHKVLEVLQMGQGVSVQRTLDPKFADLNTSGYLNGHTPFSAMTAFLGVLTAYLTHREGLIVSNEWSANEGNTVFLGQMINHQYSKSVEFEFAFRDYCRKYLSQTIEYFSILRPWHELQIGKVFAKLPAYHSAFLSCNRGQRQGRWCGECPKCLFTWIILSPFLPDQQLTQIFGQNLWQKESLLPIFQELTGITEAKSFECVGTRSESQMAVALTLKNWSDISLPPLLMYAQKEFGPKITALSQDAHVLLQSWQTQHSLSAKYERALRKWME